MSATRGPVTVFGGTGFLGARVVAALRAADRPVRIATRAGGFDTTGVERVLADVRDERAVAAALDGAWAAVNCVGAYVEAHGVTFEDVHVRGAENVAEHARLLGVSRLVHVSGIGADVASPSAYVSARGRGEQGVRELFPSATLLRPSVLFGPGGAFLRTLDDMTRFLPAVPLFGAGETRLQPVLVDDVAAAAVTSLTHAAAPGKVIELGGPRSYSYRELVTLMLTRRARRRLLLPVSFTVWELLARTLSVLPRAPLTRDQVALMREDNVVSAHMASFADLDIEPQSLEVTLARCLDAPERKSV